MANEYVVAQLRDGTWAVYRRESGTLVRFYNKALKPRRTKHEAEEDLAYWLRGKNGK